MKPFVSLIILYVRFWHSAPASAATTRVNFHIPVLELYQEEGYNHLPARFGRLPTPRGRFISSVYYTDSDLCDPNVDKTIGYPQRSNNAPWPLPSILLVDRGGCSFVTKVRNAQHAGASAVIIADNKCLCKHYNCTPSHADEVCEMREPSMVDDGSGSDISIP